MRRPVGMDCLVSQRRYVPLPAGLRLLAAAAGGACCEDAPEYDSPERAGYHPSGGFRCETLLTFGDAGAGPPSEEG